MDLQTKLALNLSASKREFNGQSVLREYKGKTNWKAANALAKKNGLINYRQELTDATDRIVSGKPFEVNFDTIDSVYADEKKVLAGLSEPIPTQKRADAENALIKEGFSADQASDAGYTLDRMSQTDIQQRAVERQTLESEIVKEIKNIKPQYSA